MRIEIFGTSSPAFEEHVERAVTAAVGQHADRIDAVVVRVEDENGPRGGVDVRCLIESLIGRRKIVIEQRAQDAYQAVSLAAERLKQSAGREVARQRDRTAPPTRAIAPEPG